MISLPQDYLEMMKELLQEDYDSYLETIDKKPYRGYRINTLKTDQERFFYDVPLPKERHPFCENGYYLNDEKISDYFGYYAGLMYSQEPSASSVVSSLDIKENMAILDLCAAPGSKTTQIAEKMNSTGLLVANDVNYKRAKVLCENISRHGICNAIVLNETMDHIANTFQESFDVILCDAPCSGEGMFRKEEMAIKQWSLSLVKQCTSMQEIALETAYTCLKQGGTLAYSTCTFNRYENELNIEQFLEKHPDMTIITVNRIFPMQKGEGHFSCIMHKHGERKDSNLKTIPSMKLDKVVENCLNKLLVKHYPYYYVKDTKVYGGTHPFIDTKGLKVLQNQVYLGEIKHEQFHPSLELALSVYTPFKELLVLSDEETNDYLRGLEIKKPTEKGYHIVSWHDYPLGIVKSDQKVLKNHYPKHLRIADGKKLI